MEATRRQKIEDKLCTVLAVIVRLFMRTFAILCALTCLICLVLVFRDAFNLVGAIAAGGVALMAWDAANHVTD